MALSLRDYQKQCIANTHQAIKDGHKKIACVMPVGSGKTSVFVRLAKDYVEQTGKQVVVLSHLSVLTTQTLRRFQIEEPGLSVGVLQADRQPERGCDVIISTMQSSRVEDKIVAFSFFESKKIGMVIVDEMHIIGTPSYDSALKNMGEHILIGFTATPFRDGHIMTNYFDIVAYTTSPKELIDNGYLVPPDMYQIEMPPHAPADERIARVTSIYLEKEYLRKAVIFMKTIEDAKLMRNSLADNGVVAHAITSELTGVKRDDLLDEFRDGGIHVLTTVNVLTAGFDAPCIEAIFMPYTTQSPTTYMQRIGRGLRQYPDKKSCRIYCFGDAPSIKKGAYKKLHDVAFNGGGKGDNIHADLEMMEMFGETGSEEYIWTVRMCDIASKVSILGLRGVEQMIIQKRFPPRFLEKLSLLINNIKNVPYDPESGAVTYRQRISLQNMGWTSDNISELTAGEASNIIAALNKARSDAMTGETDIIPSGKYAGKRVCEIPYYYKQAVLTRYPHSAMAKIIKRHSR